MNQLTGHVNKLLGRSSEIKFWLPYFVGLTVGNFFDLVTIV